MEGDMKKPLLGVVVIALLGLAFVAGRSDANDPTKPNRPEVMRIQWEYKEMGPYANDIDPTVFVQLGNDGWEMCGSRQRGHFAYLYFKREKLAGAAAAPGDAMQYFPPPNAVPTLVPQPAGERTRSERYLPPGSQAVPTTDPPTDPPAFHQQLPVAEPPAAPVKKKPIGSTGTLPSETETKPNEKASNGSPY
jgi:hypothetical protein